MISLGSVTISSHCLYGRAADPQRTNPIGHPEQRRRLLHSSGREATPFVRRRGAFPAILGSSLELAGRPFNVCNDAIPCCGRALSETASKPRVAHNSHETRRTPSLHPMALSVPDRLAVHPSRGPLLDQLRTPPALAQAALDPLVAVGMLLVAPPAFGETFEGPYLILALIVFSLTLPGDPPKGTNLRALARDVLAGWLVVVALLTIIGLATRTLGSFDPRVVFTWMLATPVTLFAARALMPVVLLRMLAQEGAQRVAVIAGEGELGRTLAARIQATPFLVVRCAVY